MLQEAARYILKQSESRKRPFDRSLVRYALQYSAIDKGRCDLALEAVSENVAVKQQVMRALLEHVGPDCVVATNTSSIDLRVISQHFGPEESRRFVGFHWFNPPVASRLTEIIRLPITGEDALATLVLLSKRVQKTPIVVGNCVGFAANRIFFPYTTCANWLVQVAGHSPYDIDRAVCNAGILMGPFATADLVGLDVGQHVAAIFRAQYSGRLDLKVDLNTPRARFASDMLANGRLGRTRGRGWYLYEEAASGGKRRPDPEVQRIFAEQGAPSVALDEAVMMMFSLMANEGAHLMHEGIVARESDIDVASILGFGFPPWLGGIMHWARRRIGWPKISSHMRKWHQRFGISLFELSPWAAKEAGNPL